jgi:alpha-ketoglutarate-dependent taurine dioxygenase
MDAVSWLAGTLPDIRSALRHDGAVLIRGLPLGSNTDLVRVRNVVMSAPSIPIESLAPRRHLGDGLYSPMHWLPERILCAHPEESYVLHPPRLVLLACMRQASAGGEPLLSDARQVLAHLPGDLVRRLRTHGWLLTRLFRERIGTSWRDVFDTDDRETLVEVLRRDAIDFDWLPDGGLRTVRHRPAVLRHADTGEECWFNQAGFLNEWNLDPAEREVLVDAFGPDGVPTNTHSGDGTPLEAEEVHAINQAYERVAVAVPWQTGDVLLLDNVLVAHGRRPYVGKREVVVAVGDRVDLADWNSVPAPPRPLIDRGA